MLQQFQLPPLPPFHRNGATRPLDETSSKKPPKGNNEGIGHKKSFSQGSVLEDQPAWLNDLLSDSNCNTQGSFHWISDSNTQGSLHCRSSSDSMAILSLDNDDDDDYGGGGGGSCGGTAFESVCVFGPNSPRRRANVDFRGKSVLEALTPRNFLEGSKSHEHGSFDPFRDGSRSTKSEQKEGKRHPRQRSRVRKLQYIAGLDRTVNDLQVLVSELQYKVSAQLQQRLTLYVENTKLKQQAFKLHQQKLVLDSEYQTLRREAERLKSGLLVRPTCQNKARMHTRSRLNHVKASDDSWELLEWGKLNLS